MAVFRCTRQHLVGLIGCCIAQVNSACYSAPAAVLWHSDMTVKQQHVMFVSLRLCANRNDIARCAYAGPHLFLKVLQHFVQMTLPYAVVACLDLLTYNGMMVDIKFHGSTHFWCAS